MNLTFDEGIHILNLTNGDNDNTLTLDVLQEYNTVLDQVEAFEGNTAFLITSDHVKTFSAGVNLEWFNEQDQATRG